MWGCVVWKRGYSGGDDKIGELVNPLRQSDLRRQATAWRVGEKAKSQKGKKGIIAINLLTS